MSWEYQCDFWVHCPNAATQVLEGLRKLEYRGYDSQDCAIFSEIDETIETERTTGFVTDLVISKRPIQGGHRLYWAYQMGNYGGVLDTNAHPHSSHDGRITVVHNGIIENAMALSNKLSKLDTGSSQRQTQK